MIWFVLRADSVVERVLDDCIFIDEVLRRFDAVFDDDGQVGPFHQSGAFGGRNFDCRQQLDFFGDLATDLWTNQVADDEDRIAFFCHRLNRVVGTDLWPEVFFIHTGLGGTADRGNESHSFVTGHNETDCDGDDEQDDEQAFDVFHV